MNLCSTATPILTADGNQLVLELADKSPPDGQMLARIPLSHHHSDIQAARDDAFWLGVRAGRLEPELSLYHCQVRPGDRKGYVIDGFWIELGNESGSFRRHYPTTVMANLARQKVLELREAQVVSTGETYRFYLTTCPATPASSTDSLPLSGTSRSPRLQLEPADLQAFLAASQPLSGSSSLPAEASAAPMPVFVTRDVWQEGRLHAHAGGTQESAALFSGRLFRDRRSPEVFACFEACLEVCHALQDDKSVTFTGDTWSHARHLLSQRRQRLGRPHEVMLASVHRHPWLPGVDERGSRTCDACAERATCSRTTAIASADDIQFHRSVFAGQPWATLVVWGYTAREEEDFRVYGLRNGALEPRSVRVLSRSLETLAR
jgi:hypothetical protein